MSAKLLKRPSAFVPSRNVCHGLVHRARLRCDVRRCASSRRGDRCPHVAIAHGRQVPIIATFAIKWFPTNRNRLHWFLPYRSARLSQRCSRCGGFDGDDVVTEAR